ncbi:shikimate kinase [Algoriphagus vanfongensis]|uniref:shikimate kinase n=1 Tax=Algoriphagus vanfongensis TaxID=426371 RepID=UPI0003FB6CFB|nr:shikimate kinase [Algoriphagus vanfongensis]
MTKQLKVVLVGLPGSGKSTFGKQLAANLDLPFYDLDTLIEQSHQMKIPDIFSKMGEGKFREIETETLTQVLSWDRSFVLASGGGCPCFNDNMDQINEHGVSVYLDVPLEEIKERLEGARVQNRPMFQGMEGGEIILKLKSLLADRESFYNQSKIKLSGSDFSTELLVSELIHLLKS